MANYQEEKVYLRNTKLNKLKPAAKNKMITLFRFNRWRSYEKILKSYNIKNDLIKMKNCHMNYF